MKKPVTSFSYLVIFLLVSSLGACTEDVYEWKSIPVKVSAYNSVSWQTDGKPNIAAWGDTLVSGMKCIAVSRDLIRLGLVHNTQVKIEGMDSIYLVKDKMNSRYTNKIDIFMGKDVAKAKEWGNKELMIKYRIKKVVEKKK